MDRPLPEYEKHINAASLHLCQENASLLGKRKKLFDLAKQDIDADGYTYKNIDADGYTYKRKLPGLKCLETMYKSQLEVNFSRLK